MEKKKKSIGYKKIIVSILSVLFVVYAYVPFISQVKADQLTYGIYTYQYGKMSYVTEPFTSANNSRWNYKTTLAFENNLYTSIDVAVTVNPLTQYTAILCENCNLTYINVSSNLIVIRMRSAMTAKVEIYSPSNPLIVDAWNYGNPVTTYTDGNFDYDANMNTYIVRTEQHVETIERYVGAVNRSIISLANDLGYSSTHTLESDLNTIKTAIVASGVTQSALLTQLNKLADIDNKLTSINANLSATNLGIVDMVDHLEDYFSNIQNVDNIYSKLTALNDKLDTIITTLNNINTTVSNIDNVIDTISWTNCNVTVQGVYSDTTFNTGVTSGEIPGSYKYIKLTSLNDVYNFRTDLFKLNITIGNALVLDNLRFYWLNNGTYLTEISPTVYYFRRYRNSFELYLDFQNEFTYHGFPNGSGNIVIKLSDNNPTGLYLYGNSFVHRISQNDIEYWQLLNYFDRYKMNRQILNAIQGISVNITQNDITEMNTNITEYNTTMTDINQIENNYINNFNTIDNNIDLTNNSSPSVNLVDARLQFNSVFNDITADLRIRGLLIFVLICGIILILLGA